MTKAKAWASKHKWWAFCICSLILLIALAYPLEYMGINICGVGSIFGNIVFIGTIIWLITRKRSNTTRSK